MLFVKAPLKEAEPTRRKMVAAGIFSTGYLIEKDEQYIYFPATGRAEGFELVGRKGTARKYRPRSLRDALEGKLPAEDLDKLVTSFDTLGDIAVIEIRNGLDEKLIGQAILDSNPSIKTVLKKAGSHEGPYRIMPVKVIAGENKTTATYREHGIKMKIAIDQVYFSPRLSSERLRIANQVEDGETIAGFFAGVGPFPLVIAKKKKCTIYAVELNPKAYKLMEENIKLNRLKGEVIPLLGDVRKISQTIPKCDRVLMPSPKTGESFLVPCMLAAKKGAIMHYYEFAPDGDLYSGAIAKIKEAAASLGRAVSITNKKVVRPHAVRVSQVAIDFRID